MMIKNTIYKHSANNNSGSAMLWAISALAVLTIIGIFSITTSNIELNIATNNVLYKQAFYAADGGTEVARELIEQNISCPDGFASQPLTISSAVVEDKSFAFEEDAPGSEYPSDTSRDVHFPASNSQPHTNIIAFGNTHLSTGSALQMAAGYEGKGKGTAGGGGEIVYDVYSKHENPGRNSRSCIAINYIHIIGHEGDCLY